MKQSSIFLSLALAIVLAGFTSCKGNKSIITPTSSGLPYELIVVVDPDVWDRPAGRTLYDVLTSDIPGLPQPEASFKVMYTAPGNYDRALKLIRNIIIVDIKQDIYTQAGFKHAKDVYAAPQTILSIQAPTEEEFQKFVEERQQDIISFFTRAEMNRQIITLEKKHSDLVSQKVSELFDCEVWLPGELISSKTGENFFWAATNSATADQNFVIYSYPYTDKNTFTKDFFIHKRDSVMQINMPGAPANSYMITDPTAVEVESMSLQGEYAFEARGLWRVKGDFMGGPFVSHSRVDTLNQRVITAEVFIYSPDRLKGSLVRRMEASLYTLKLPAKREKDNAQADTIQ
jgi:hypothetical protein